MRPGCGYERVMTTIPAVVILPRNTEEVQRIVKICNRYKVPYVPYSTGFYGPRSHCHVENELLIDLKRLNDYEIDEKHLYAVVGTGVIYSPFQQEAFNHGGYGIIGGGGAQASVIANLIGDGWSPLSHRVGLPHRRILGHRAGPSRWRDREDGFPCRGRRPLLGRRSRPRPERAAEGIHRTSRVPRHRHEDGGEAAALPAGEARADGHCAEYGPWHCRRSA